MAQALSQDERRGSKQSKVNESKVGTMPRGMTPGMARTSDADSERARVPAGWPGS